MVKSIKVMVISDENFKFLRSMEDKELSKLLIGIHNFFEMKFPPDKFSIKPVINSHGYHINYLEVDYSFNFSHENNLYFRLRAELKEHDNDLEKRLDQCRISNTQLNETTYLADQRISSNGDSVDVNCRIKRMPNSEHEINDLCGQLFGYIIKNVFISINPKLK